MLKNAILTAALVAVAVLSIPYVRAVIHVLRVLKRNRHLYAQWARESATGEEFAARFMPHYMNEVKRTAPSDLR